MASSGAFLGGDFTRTRSTSQVASLSLSSDRPLDPRQFLPWIQNTTQQFGVDILRMKGIVAFSEDPNRFVVQSVHMLIEGGYQRPWKSEERRESRLVFIGRNLPKDILRQQFEACRV